MLCACFSLVIHLLKYKSTTIIKLFLLLLLLLHMGALQCVLCACFSLVIHLSYTNTPLLLANVKKKKEEEKGLPNYPMMDPNLATQTQTHTHTHTHTHTPFTHPFQSKRTLIISIQMRGAAN